MEEYGCGVQQPSFSIYPFALLAISPSFVKSAVAAGGEFAQNVLPGVSISCREERRWQQQLRRISERGKVMNGTVGKLAGDGPRTFVTPIGVVSVVRLDFGLLLLFCKKKEGGATVCLNASRASHVSCKVQRFVMETEAQMRQDSDNDRQFLPSAFIVH